jgi:hypothetical protein
MATARKQGGILVARQTGSATTPDGEVIAVTAGHTRVREGHPLLDATPAEWWEPITAHYEVEQATAAPGEQRGAKS